MADSTLLKLGGLWISQDKNGNDYFSGDYTNGTKMLIYKNTYKNAWMNPNFRIGAKFLSDNQEWFLN